MDKACKKCGKRTSVLYADEYCDDCYGDIWDKGFSVSSEWADHLEHMELTTKLDEAHEGNPEAFESTVIRIMNDFKLGDWSCARCGAVRLRRKDQVDADARDCLRELLKPCPDCGAKGHLDHEG